MKAAFQGTALFAVLLMVSAFFFTTISGGASGQAAGILSLGTDTFKLGTRLLLPVGLVLAWFGLAR